MGSPSDFPPASKKGLNREALLIIGATSSAVTNSLTAHDAGPAIMIATFQLPAADELEALVGARHHDPFSLLGLHRSRPGLVPARVPALRHERFGAHDSRIRAHETRPCSGRVRLAGRRSRRRNRSCCGSANRGGNSKPAIPTHFHRPSARTICTCSTKAAWNKPIAYSAAASISATASAACALPAGRRMPRGSASSANSIGGTGARTRCRRTG